MPPNYLFTLLDKWPYLAPVVAAAVVIIYIRRVQKRLAEKGIDACAFRNLLHVATIRFSDVLVARRRMPNGEKLEVGIEPVCSEGRNESIIRCYLNRRQVINYLDVCAKEIMVTGLVAVALLLFVLYLVLQIETATASLLAAALVVPVLLFLLILSRWEVEILRVEGLLRDNGMGSGPEGEARDQKMGG